MGWRWAWAWHMGIYSLAPTLLATEFLPFALHSIHISSLLHCCVHKNSLGFFEIYFPQWMECGNLRVRKRDEDEWNEFMNGPRESHWELGMGTGGGEGRIYLLYCIKH